MICLVKIRFVELAVNWQLRCIMNEIMKRAEFTEAQINSFVKIFLPRNAKLFSIVRVANRFEA